MYHRFIKIYELPICRQLLLCSLLLSGSFGCYDAMRSDIFEEQELSNPSGQDGESTNMNISMEGGMDLMDETGGMVSSGGSQELGGMTGGEDTAGNMVMGGETIGGQNGVGGNVEEDPFTPTLTIAPPLSPTFKWLIQDQIRGAWSFDDQNWIIQTADRLLFFDSTHQYPLRWDIPPNQGRPLQALTLPLLFLPNTLSIQNLVIKNEAAHILIFSDGIWIQAQSHSSTETFWLRLPVSDEIDQLTSAVVGEEGLWLSDSNGILLLNRTQLTRFPSLAHLNQSMLTAVSHQQSGILIEKQGALHLLRDRVLSTHSTWKSTSSPVSIANQVWTIDQEKLTGGVLDQAWQSIDLPFNPLQVWSAETEQSQTPPLLSLWLLSSEGIWRLQTPLSTPNQDKVIRFLPIEGQWWGGTVDSKGRLLLWGPNGLGALTLQREAIWSGEPNLNERGSTLTLKIDDLDNVTSLQWWIDEEIRSDVELTSLSETQSNLFELSLSNLNVDEGNHFLHAAVEYENGDLVEASYELQVQTRTRWETVVQPIYEANCSNCHQPQGGALDLSSLAAWATHFDEILFVTRMQSMPIGLPPLNSEQIESLELWRLGSFME